MGQATSWRALPMAGMVPRRMLDSAGHPSEEGVGVNCCRGRAAQAPRDAASEAPIDDAAVTTIVSAIWSWMHWRESRKISSESISE